MAQKDRHMTLTDGTELLDLDAIKARCEAATPGPWANEPDTGAGRVWVRINHRGDFEPIWPWRGHWRRLFQVRTDRDRETWTEDAKREVFAARARDGAFVAAARTDVPALVAEVERLRDELADARRVLQFADGNSCVISGWPLARLYAEDCEWAQNALRAAECHDRDYLGADDGI